jgi:NAD(P)-dependent dehydrogenase (short-subunit alcohol dehydrogenase family)
MPTSHDTANLAPRKDRVWFITGASTGFGRILSEEILKSGGRVVATARNRDKVADLEQQYPESAKTLTLDVTKPSQIDSATSQAIAHFGRIDVLVNNAGYGIAGAIEEANEAEYMPVFNTNVFGVINTTRALLPQFRKQRSGNILNLSSIAGLSGGAGWGYYNATKFAVEGFSEALAAELAPLGIHVTVIEPGPFRTDFLGRSGVEAGHRIHDYDDTAGKAREYLNTQSGKQAGDPLRAVHAMMALVESPNPPVHLILGAIALKRFRTKLEQWDKEIAAWEQTTLSTDFPEGQ